VARRLRRAGHRARLRGGQRGLDPRAVALSSRYSGVEHGELIVDLLVLGAFVGIALRTERFWPLWVAGLQLTSSFGHLLKWADAGLLPPVYGVAIRLWSYPILIIIAIGAWRYRRRAMSQPAFPAFPT
jgi:hypothetical protein